MNLPRSTYVPRQSRTAHAEMLNDEICIYEWTAKRVHALNATAAQVWALCDGTRSVAEIAETLRREIGLHADDVVALAVAQFSEAGLLEAQVPAGTLALSRRRMVKQLGLTAAMLPVVSSIAAPSALEAASGNTQVFNLTGAAQTFVVPAGVTQVTVDALGAAGANPLPFPVSVGRGGRVNCTIPVTAAEALIVNVGGAGTESFTLDTSGTGGFNGGGQGGGNGGGGGGGASDVRRGSTKLVVAGGGGGDGAVFNFVINIPGGAGGGTTAVAGQRFNASGGGGGTQTAGGSGGTGGIAGTSGTSGIGGNGGPATAGTSGGGGGGGGYFGGGGGAGGTPPPSESGGGGGGSSYTDPSATNVTHAQGVQSGNGKVTLTW